MEPGALAALLRGRRSVVLSGAGCSTESGIPDYRGEGSPRRKRSPIRYGEFVGSPEVRRRYWARSTVGWPRMAGARPNAGHRALARLEGTGMVAGVITQNVDGLHQAGGSRRVLELHGSLADVLCLGCGAVEGRDALQERILALNPGWSEAVGTRERDLVAPGLEGAPEAAEAADGERDRVELAPDGDAEVSGRAVREFRVPVCLRCGGVLKPDVVFFGENVPRPRVERAWSLYEEADVLLVVGSSLQVYSGRRFTQRAGKEGRPVAVVNLGPTRADEVARVRVEGRTGEVLPRLADLLLGQEAVA